MSPESADVPESPESSESPGSESKTFVTSTSFMSPMSPKVSLPLTEKDLEKGEKKKKKEGKKVSDLLKLNMANERTFMKWVVMGMHMGAIGTFVLLALDRDRSTVWGIFTLGFAWAVGFSFAFYGLVGYYGRRRALEKGDVTSDPAEGRAIFPIIVTMSMVAVVVAGLVYVGVAGQQPKPTAPVHPASKL